MTLTQEWNLQLLVSIIYIHKFHVESRKHFLPFMTKLSICWDIMSLSFELQMMSEINVWIEINSLLLFVCNDETDF